MTSMSFTHKQIYKRQRIKSIHELALRWYRRGCHRHPFCVALLKDFICFINSIVTYWTRVCRRSNWWSTASRLLCRWVSRSIRSLLPSCYVIDCVHPSDLGYEHFLASALSEFWTTQIILLQRTVQPSHIFVYVGYSIQRSPILSGIMK